MANCHHDNVLLGASNKLFFRGDHQTYPMT